MSAEIEKMAVYDSRIVQERPAYGVQKGGLSYSNSPFSAIAATSSQMSFNINVPSQNVFMDREVLWSSDLYLQVDVALAGEYTYVSGSARANRKPLLRLGDNCALSAFPLHKCVSTMTATINDTTSTINTSDVINEVLRFVNQKKNRLQRTCPTMLDKYAINDDGARAINGPTVSYAESSDYDNVNNGSFWNVAFTDQNGDVLGADGQYPTGLTGANDAKFVGFTNGVPLVGGNSAANSQDGTLALNYRLFLKLSSTEKLVLSPFIFSEECGDETGLFGLNNIQLVMNFKQPNRVLRALRVGALTVQNGAQNQPTENLVIGSLNSNYIQGANRPWGDAKVDCLFITPSLDLALPPKSVVPYLEYPRYLQQQQNVPANSRIELRSQTLVLPQVPDMLVIYAKANRLGGADATSSFFGDFYLPLKKISLNFDNYSGLLSSHRTEQLYNISVDNGLEMDWNSWNGVGYAPKPGEAKTRANLVGGFLVLRFGKDIQLQAAQAPGVVGNYTLQYNVDCVNPFDVEAQDVVLYTMTVNSGFFETQAGSSRILKGPITESDVINARENASSITRSQLERMVGGSFWSKLGTALNKAKDVLMNPAVRSVVKSVGKQTPLKGAIEMAEKMGYGVSGGAMTGGASQTGGRRRKGLHSLM
jgi:hypothetical protein